MGSKKKIGLYFGSYNPLHVGHLHVADCVVDQTDVNHVMFVLTPQSPDKIQYDLLDVNKRLEIMLKSIGDSEVYSICLLELDLPQPNFTHITLRNLREIHPDVEFSIILGVDNVINLHKWVNIEEISLYHKLYIVNRPGYFFDFKDLSWYNNSNYELVNIIDMNVSSTIIRQKIKKGESIKYLVPDDSIDLIQNFYSL